MVILGATKGSARIVARVPEIISVDAISKPLGTLKNSVTFDARERTVFYSPALPAYRGPQKNS